jgi:hypothetical protein
MSRSSKIEKITTEDIYRSTSMGREIFEKELGTINPNKNISSPVRGGDNNPSARIKPSKTSGIWLLTDHTTGEFFTPISFIERIYGLSFQDAVNKIAWDFGLKTDKGIILDKVPLIETKQEVIHKPLLYEFQEMKFKDKHHKYWNAGELYEDYLRKNNVFAASKIAINKKVIKIPSDELCFVYLTGDSQEKGMKILRIGPNIQKKDKFRTNITNHYLWNYYKYKNTYVDNLFVLKSRKDELVMNLLGYDTISSQSENAEILDLNMPKILPLADSIILSYGSDADGVKKSKQVQQKYNTKYYNTPKNLLQFGINDQFSYVAQFGLKSLDNHIKTRLKL